ncbi:hypothetical protein [Helicobacter bizzozeronii]|uniref:hypothetical protein n=1 Tax=Helicobacter bizzozeronii TaxID=56877 RepID=UPI001F3950A0|nr:hypothetical protein [Helicobacter bizzozeronii]
MGILKKWVVVFLTCYTLHALSSIHTIEEAIHQMAIYQASVRKNISLFNEKLNSIARHLRLDNQEDHFREMAIINGVVKQNASLFQVLQDYYSNTLLFDYLGGILQGYIAIAQDVQQSTQLAPLIPLVQEIIGQLQVMAMLEAQITQLIEE